MTRKSNSSSARKHTNARQNAQSIAGKKRFTGAKIIIFRNSNRSPFKAFTQQSSLKLSSISDFGARSEGVDLAFKQSDGLFFDKLNLAVVNPEHSDALNFTMQSFESSSKAFIIEPERYVYALPATKGAPLADNSNCTWGIQAIKGMTSEFTGEGVNIAILDTGLDLNHPDFADISVSSKSFVDGEDVQDLNGHGTHCCGLAVGAINRSTGVRYGVAHGANLFAGKVLSNSGTGKDRNIFAGINWALENQCRVISMSLGSYVEAGKSFLPQYEQSAQRAMQHNCLIIAAAGNESQRSSGIVEAVCAPANCPSVMAVAALDQLLKPADFSCGCLNTDGGQVDIAAPGVDIMSAWKGKKYNSISGTSMATPLVAGLAALLCEENPKAKPAEIWMKLSQNALRLQELSTDVGSGLAQALN